METIIEPSLSPVHSKTFLISTYEKGTELLSLCKFSDAERVLLKCMNSYENLSTDLQDPPLMALISKDIGLTYASQARFYKALNYYDRCLSIRQTYCEDTHLELARLYLLQGRAQRGLADYKEAEILYEKAAKIIGENTQQNNSERIELYYERIMLCLDIGKQDEAMRLAKIIGEINNDKSEQKVPTALVYESQAGAYRGKEQFVEALKSIENALEIYTTHFPEGHLSIPRLYQLKGIVEVEQKQFNIALVSLEKSVELYRSYFTEDNPDVAKSFNYLGMVAMFQLKGSKSLIYLNDSIRIMESFDMADHPDIGLYYCNIGVYEVINNNIQGGLENHLKAINILAKKLGENHHHLAQLYENVGLMQRRKNQPIECLSALMKCVGILNQTPRENKTLFARALTLFGETHRNMHDHETGINLIRKSLVILPNQTPMTWSSIRGLKNYEQIVSQNRFSQEI
jgi:tetratricopeptide (TPR) repeat protein